MIKQRKPDWQERLQDAFKNARSFDFQYGTRDCALFCCYCVDAMTGSNTAVQVKDKFKWKNKIDAFRLISARPLLELTTDVLGVPAVAGDCMAGDVMLIKHDNECLLAMHEGHMAVCLSDVGVIQLPLSQALCGWRIQ